MSPVLYTADWMVRSQRPDFDFVYNLLSKQWIAEILKVSAWACL